MNHQEAKEFLESLPGDAILAVMKTRMENRDVITLSLTCHPEGDEPVSHIGLLERDKPILEQLQALRGEFLDIRSNHDLLNQQP